MNSRRFLQSAAWTLMAVTTASVVLAAKPVDQSDAAAEARANRILKIVQTAVGQHLEMPSSLDGQRIKIRFAPQLRARLLPNGELLSLNGHDLTSLSEMLFRMDATLSPAVSASESTINRIKFVPEMNGLPTVDIAGTFWVDLADVRKVKETAKKLDRLSEVEMVTFARSTTVPEAQFAPRRQPKPMVATPMPAPERPVYATGPSLEWEQSQFSPPITVGKEREAQYIEALRQLEQNRIERKDAHLAECKARVDANRDTDGQRGLGGGKCCYAVHIDDIQDAGISYGPGYEQYCTDAADDDDCEAQALGAGAEHFTFLDGVTDCQSCDPERFGSCCTAQVGNLGTRDGEDNTKEGCEPINWGDSDPSLNPNFPLDGGAAPPANVYGYNRDYGNCESCRLVYGSCCIGEAGIDNAGIGDSYFAGSGDLPKFGACDNFDPANPPLGAPVEAFGYPSPVQNWTVLTNPPNPASASVDAGNWSQPNFAIVTDAARGLATYTGNRTPNGNFVRVGPDTAGGPGWQGFDLPTQMSNPSRQRVIGSTRLVTNSDDESACDRCTAMGGAYIGSVDFEYQNGPIPTPGQYPVLFYAGDILCNGGSTGITDCETGASENLGSGTYTLGGCTMAGETTIVSWATCAGGVPDGFGTDYIWAAGIIDPSLMVPDPSGGLIHSEHGNWMRPTWSIWFTPPSNTNYDEQGTFDPWETWCPPQNPFNLTEAAIDPLCAPGQPTANGRSYLVPPWEYIGSAIEWTGWNPTRWWNEGVRFSPLLSAGQYRDAMPSITGRPDRPAGAPGFNETGIYAAPTSAQFPFIQNPGHFGAVSRFGLPPTGVEFETQYGLANQRGYPLTWADPSDPFESWWPTYPRLIRGAYHWQMNGTESGLFGYQYLYPFDFGWQRWTDDSKMFDIDQSLTLPPGQADPTFQLGGRYLNTEQPGITKWQYMGDQANLPAFQEQAYVFPYFPGSTDIPLSGEPTRGSCFFHHSEKFPTIPGTANNEAYPGEQEVYIGNYCNEAACCDYVATQIARCCTAAPGAEWDALCVQIAVDQYLADRASATPFLNYTCSGISPYIVPQFPTYDPLNPPTYAYPAGTPAPESILGQGTYNPDPQNIALNPLLSGLVEDGRIPGNGTLRVGVLPRFVDPTYADPALGCAVADQSTSNSLWPPAPVAALSSGLTNDFLEYADQRDRAARLYQFMPRCQGIYSSAGQCNVPGTKSGRSSWEQVAEDEDILIGCQDFDCCMRVMSRMLDEKDAADPTHQLSDFEWMPKQWTPKMAMVARELCYPSVQTVNLDPDAGGDPNNAPDFFALQINGMAEAHQVVTDNSGQVTNEWIAGPSPDPESVTGMHDVSADQALRQLIWAPFSWSDPTLDDGATCMPAHQNMYEMCPEPYYGADGLAQWPDINLDSDIAQTQEAFTSFTAAVRYLQELSDLDPPTPPLALNAYGAGIKIAVLAEAAWLQEYDLFGRTLGAVHQDLQNVILEDDVYMDFTDPVATARGTAVLGVLAAADNGFGVTGLSHEATTTFYPTRGTEGSPGIGTTSRLEDAFVSALDPVLGLGPGDVMLLAYTPASGQTIVNDLASQPFINLAVSMGITVVVPAGDQQADVGEPPALPGLEGVIVVAASTPAKDDQYLRWWSSNYTTTDTVTAGAVTPGLPNLCAWGGGVVTTGGNANLTTLTVQDAIDLDAETGEYSLTSIGKEWSFTNDFGANLDGSIAAASQIAAVVANLQGFSKEWYGAVLNPGKTQDFLWESATYGPEIGGYPAGRGGIGPANAGDNIYTWDLDEVNAAEPRCVGRLPQLGRLLQQFTSALPDEDDFWEFGCQTGLVGAYPITGTILDGGIDPAVTLRDPDDIWLVIQSERSGPGSVSMPANAGVTGINGFYPWNREITDILCTFQTTSGSYVGPDFGILTTRDWLDFAGQFFVKIYDFDRGAWRDFQFEYLPSEVPEYIATPFPGTPTGFQRYLSHQSTNCPEEVADDYSRYYIRIMTQNDLEDHSTWRLDFVDVIGMISPRPPQP
ncbi:MAG: hypothetical protein HOO04_02770 [Phycisphaerae bacterium]|nr:hypothetical protein [Phycisphaerae bacterium]